MDEFEYHILRWEATVFPNFYTNKAILHCQKVGNNEKEGLI